MSVGQKKENFIYEGILVFHFHLPKRETNTESKHAFHYI